MKRMIYIMIIVPIVACAHFLNGTIPIKNASFPSAAIAIKLSTDRIIARVYFQKDTLLYQAQKFGDYYILFYAVPGTYSLSYGESIEERHIFSDAMAKECTVTITANDLVFLGDYKLTIAKEDVIYGDAPRMMIMPDLNREVERTDYYYADPVKSDNVSALKDFGKNMGEKLDSKGWDSSQFHLL